MSLEQPSESLQSLTQLEEAYRETYPGDELRVKTCEAEEYDLVLENNRTYDIRFVRDVNFSDQPIDNFVEQGELDIPSLTQIYRREAQNPATRVIEFSPEAKEISEEQENLWYGFTDSIEDVLDPDVFVRPNRYDCVYFFDLSG